MLRGSGEEGNERKGSRGREKGRKRGINWTKSGRFASFFLTGSE